MTDEKLNIRRFDSRRDDVREALGELRLRLSPRGDITSAEDRRRTKNVFGRQLTPAEVAEC